MSSRRMPAVLYNARLDSRKLEECVKNLGVIYVFGQPGTYYSVQSHARAPYPRGPQARATPLVCFRASA